VSIFDYYKILGCTRASSQEELKDAHRRLSRKYHPDMGSEDKAAFSLVQRAWQALRTPILRANHTSLLISMGDACPDCDRRGVRLRQKSFRLTLRLPCPTCGGCGYVARSWRSVHQ